MTIPGHESRTDWERVLREYDSDAPIAYDPEDGPYDPNDEAATDAFFKQATIWKGWPNPVLIQEDGVPVNQRQSRFCGIGRTPSQSLLATNES
jgi:hypothetical protein